MPPLPEDDDATDPSSRRSRNWFSGLFGPESAREHGANGAPLSAEDTALVERGRAMRLRIREFETLRVGDVMVPRADVSGIELNATFAELLQAFSSNTVSRLPVYRNNLDDPVGFIHLKDVIGEIAKGMPDSGARLIDKLKRELLFVPPSMRIHDLLVKMQTSRMHLALVVDEYGGTDGLVTLEDLVEQIVGDIEDEHDEDEGDLLHQRAKGVWDADAKAEIEDFAEETGFDLSMPDFEDEIDTLGGLAFALAGRVPQRGELIKHPTGVDIEIVEADGRRIRKLRLRLPSELRKPLAKDAPKPESSQPEAE